MATDPPPRDTLTASAPWLMKTMRPQKPSDSSRNWMYMNFGLPTSRFCSMVATPSARHASMMGMSAMKITRHET